MIIIFAANISLLYKSVNDLSETMAFAVNGGQWYYGRCAGTKKLWDSRGVDNTTRIPYSKDMSAVRVDEELTESFKCTVNPRQLLSAHKNHVRETSLFTSDIPNQVRNSQTSRFVSLPSQNL